MSDQMFVKKRSGESQLFDVDKIRKVVESACAGLQVQSHVLESQIRVRFADGMETRTIQKSLIDAAVKLTTAQAPSWRIVAARLLLMDLKKDLEAQRGYGPLVNYAAHAQSMVAKGLYDPKILDTWPLEWFEGIENEDAERLFDYAGANILRQRYLVRDTSGVIVESVGEMFLTVAILLTAQNYGAFGLKADLTAKDVAVREVRKAFDLLISRKISLATPLLRNLRRVGGSLTSCFVLQMDDSRDSIFYTIDQIARISKNGGGVGMDVTPVRAKGSPVHGMPGVSGGVIPWIRIANDTFVAVNQTGARAGAGTIALRIWHKDVLDFLELQTENGDQRRKAFDIYPQLVIPDLFMKRVEEGGAWTLVCPFEVRSIMGDDYDLVDVWGEEFERRYTAVEKAAQQGLVPSQTIAARKMVQHIVSVQIETGLPYLCFIDTINRMNPNQGDGMIPSANLCVSGDTRILTERGYEKAIDLYNSGENPRVVVDHRFSGTGTDELVTPTVRMVKTAQDADLYQVIMADGSMIKCTSWHKFPVIMPDGSFVLTPLKDLAEGAQIYLHKNTRASGSMDRPGAAYLAGIMAGDGDVNYSRGIAKISLYHEKQSLLPALDAAWLECGFTKPNPRSTDSCNGWEDNRTRFGGVDMFRFMQAQNIRKDVVPEWLFQSNEETIYAYLRGLFDTDGTCCQIRNKNSAPSLTVQIGSINLDLLREVKTLASMVGLRGRIQTTRKEGMYPLPDANREDKDYFCQTAYRLDFNGDNAWSFMEKVGTNLPSKRATYDSVKSERMEVLGRYKSRKSEGWTTTIESITYVGKEDVYDVTVEPSHTVVFNGMATGQCTESYSNVKRTKVGDLVVNADNKIVQQSTPGLIHCCNLLSINQAEITDEDLPEVCHYAVRLLDASVDLTLAPIPEAKLHNDWYRTIGVGVMGWADWLARRDIAYDSPEALAEADRVFELIGYHCYIASHALALKHGTFGAFEKSEQKKGILFGKTGAELAASGLLGEKWLELTQKIAEEGCRHSQVLAIAPTTSTSLIQGCTSSMLPPYGKFFFDKNGGQTVPICPPYLEEKFWYYKEFRQIDQKNIVNMTATVQKWIDTGISMELLFDLNDDKVTAKYIYDVIAHAWKSGVKCVYYVRSVQKALTREEACVSCSG